MSVNSVKVIDASTANVQQLAKSRQPTWGDELRAYEHGRRNIVDPRLLDGKLFIL